MSPFLTVFLVLVLGSTSYAAGRLHGQLSYRIGYRFGYRQGYFDGDRGAWNRRRRQAHAVIASALTGPASSADGRGAATRSGTTYTGSSFTAPSGTVAVAPPSTTSPRHATGTLVRRRG